MDRRGVYALVAFGVGALCLGVAAKLIERSRHQRPDRLAKRMSSHLGDLRRRTTAFDATTLVS